MRAQKINPCAMYFTDASPEEIEDHISPLHVQFLDFFTPDKNLEIPTIADADNNLITTIISQ